MKKKILSLMLGTIIFSTTAMAGTKVLAVSTTDTTSKIINSQGNTKEETQIDVKGSIGAWDNTVDIEQNGKPEIAQLSITVPTKMAFTVATNTKDDKNEKGNFISPEYKITNNGKEKAVKVTLERVNKKNSDTNTLELNTVTTGNKKVEIDLELKLGDSGKAVKVKETSSVQELGEIAKGTTEKLKLQSDSWELPTQELKNGIEKVQSSHELILGFALK